MSKSLKGLIVGIANEQSIAWGCAKALRAEGAELALTYLNDKAKPHAEPLAKEVDAPVFMPLDVCEAGQMEKLFGAIKTKWGKLDFLIHSIAFAPANDLHGRVTDCSLEGFTKALDISCHSLIRLCKAAEPLMSGGGAVVTMSYYGAEKAVPNYGVMGIAKAALESSVRYLATELGPKNIRVNAISPGPVKTRAASGIADFEKMIREASAKAPLREPVSTEQVGNLAAFLVSDKASLITGQVLYVDGGYSILG